MGKPYLIKYSNHFTFNGETFAFKRKMLFNITKTPFYVPIRYRSDGSKGIVVNKQWLSWSEIEKLAKNNNEKSVDISNLQWYQQVNLEECFNL